MAFAIRQANPAPAAFTRRGRPGGASNIHQIQIHATRGATTLDKQVQATENWFSSQPDKGGWGSSADFVVGPDSRESGKMVIVQFGNWIRQFSSWSAGYGAGGAATEWGAAEVGVAIEVAQPARFDGTNYLPGDSDVAFNNELMEAVAWLCNHINDELVKNGGTRIPSVHLPYWNQLRSNAVPRGYIGHDDLANGRKLGKTDPGKMWTWAHFIRLLNPFGLIVPGTRPIQMSSTEGIIAAMRYGTHPSHFVDGNEVHTIIRPRR
jgi:hypothetical protein